MLYSPKGQKDQKGGPDRIEMFLEFPRRKKESNHEDICFSTSKPLWK